MTEEHSLMIRSGVSSPLFRKEHKDVFFFGKAINFLLKNKVLLKILYWCSVIFIPGGGLGTVQ